MQGYLSNRWTKIGIVIAILGWGPLIAIISLAGLGLWPDPNPNPVGPGLLFALTAWPAIICWAVGAFQTWRENR